MFFSDGWLPRQVGERDAPAAAPARRRGSRTPAAVRDPEEPRSCCCPAPPRVRVVVIVPGRAGTRGGSVDLLLCAHHYRTSELRLAEHGVLHVEVLYGATAENALLGDARLR